MKVKELTKMLEATDKKEFELKYPVYDDMGNFVHLETIESISIITKENIIVLSDGRL